MFVVTEAEAAAIRAVYEQRGEFSAAVELRRLFPAVTDTAQARACARTIAGWKPLPAPPRLATRRNAAAAGSSGRHRGGFLLREESDYRNKSNKIRSETWPTRMC